MTDGSNLIDELLAKIGPRHAEVKVCVDQELIDRHAALELELLAAAEADTKDNGLTLRSAEVADRLAALEDEINAAQVTFRFESIGAAAWTRLLAENPPTRDQRALRHQANPLTFNPAIVAASCVDPKMTLEQATRLEEKLTAGQWQPILRAALDVNERGGDTPKSQIGTAIRLLRDSSSITAVNGASPEASSLAGN